jgi:hypothetical protein
MILSNQHRQFYLLFFSGAFSCYPFQSLVPDPGTKGFTLLSGLRALRALFCIRKVCSSPINDCLLSLFEIPGNSSILAIHKKSPSMEPQPYIRLSALNDMIHDTIRARFEGQRFWVLADITNHSYKSDKKIHYFELVEKAQNGNAITAKIMGKSWGTGAIRIEEFEKYTGQAFTNNLQYIRVSTDEQAEKGFSQRNQEEMLRKYCSINHKLHCVFEDHSAKTFNRPQWKKFLDDVKKNKNKINLVLFMKWDRFSRNAGDAYQMINVLIKLGIES